VYWRNLYSLGLLNVIESVFSLVESERARRPRIRGPLLCATGAIRGGVVFLAAHLRSSNGHA
ncbi:MAG: hypothetical protein VW390_11940, partial [Gammaproteobacteria bacterium]